MLKLKLTVVVLLMRIEVLLYQRVLAVLAACGSDASGLDRCRPGMPDKMRRPLLPL